MTNDELMKERDERFVVLYQRLGEIALLSPLEARAALRSEIARCHEELQGLAFEKAIAVEAHREQNPSLAETREEQDEEFVREMLADGNYETGVRMSTVQGLEAQLALRLAEVVVVLNPPYLAKRVPADMLEAYRERSIPMDMGSVTYYRLGLYDFAVSESGDDHVGVDVRRPTSPDKSNRAKAAVREMDSEILLWQKHVKQLADAHLRFPPADDLRNKNDGVFLVFSRGRDAHPSAIRVGSSIGQESKPIIRYRDGRWDGSQAEAAESWKSVLALDLGRELGTSLAAALDLSDGRRPGGGLMHLIDEIDSKLGASHRETTIVVSALKLAEWVASCEASFPNGRERSELRLPLPELRLRQVEASRGLEGRSDFGD